MIRENDVEEVPFDGDIGKAVGDFFEMVRMQGEIDALEELFKGF